MNIFVLDTDPKAAALAHCDKHVVKMILETAQILSTVWHSLPTGAHYAIPAEAYRPTHRHHPCVLWAARSSENYEWLCQLGEALVEEFEHRYGHTHKTAAVLKALRNPPCCVPVCGPTPFVCCMPDEFIVEHDAVASYRAYYTNAKAHLLTYTNAPRPRWLNS